MDYLSRLDDMEEPGPLTKAIERKRAAEQLLTFLEKRYKEEPTRFNRRAMLGARADLDTAIRIWQELTGIELEY